MYAPSPAHPVLAAPRRLFAQPPALPTRHTADILVVGGGAAGLTAALRAAAHARVILLTRGPLLQSNSARAQGGIAAALDPLDAPALQVADTLAAGAGLCDGAAVETLAADAPDIMRDLAARGVAFEREAGAFVLGLEGGHSRRRIVHAADATGWALTSVLAREARASAAIRIFEGYQAVDLLGSPGSCDGLLARDAAGGWHEFHAAATVMAGGGAGALYGLTSNHPHALGEGIALAYRAGAEVADMEFVQFHPTVFRTGSGQGFLISEAARGEGGRLLTPTGRRFMLDVDPRAELAPRDVVARGIFDAMRRAGSDHVLLDLTHLDAEALARRFPGIVKRCRGEGLDPATARIPVAPAAHYLMGGIRTDLDGATSLAGLYAAGECACTGVHGANRLASNSLLECLVFGRRAADAALDYIVAAPSFGANAPPAHEVDPSAETIWPAELAALMREEVGLSRSADGLRQALGALAARAGLPASADGTAISLANAALTARLIAASALLREESRGAHQRADFRQTDKRWHGHLVLARDQPPRLVETIADTQPVTCV